MMQCRPWDPKVPAAAEILKGVCPPFRDVTLFCHLEMSPLDARGRAAGGRGGLCVAQRLTDTRRTGFELTFAVPYAVATYGAASYRLRLGS